MNIFDDVVQETQSSPAMTQATQEVDVKAWATKKVGAIFNVLDTIDKKIFALSNPTKGMETPDAQKEIDRLTTSREKLVQGVATPEFFATATKASQENGEVVLKLIDPRAYANMSIEQQKRVQELSAKATAYGTEVKKREAGTILSAQ